MNSPSNDLTQLVYSAHKATNRASPLSPTKPTARFNKTTLAASSVALAAFIWGAYFYSSYVSSTQRSEDARALLIRAKEAIDKEFMQEGRLPSVIPDPLVASWVHYEISNAESRPPVYQLRVELHGNQQTLRSE